MKDEEFRSIKVLKLKYRRGDQIIQTFCRIGSPQKFGPPGDDMLKYATDAKNHVAFP